LTYYSNEFLKSSENLTIAKKEPRKRENRVKVKQLEVVRFPRNVARLAEDEIAGS
jgi:hypothetical protein